MGLDVRSAKWRAIPEEVIIFKLIRYLLLHHMKIIERKCFNNAGIPSTISSVEFQYYWRLFWAIQLNYCGQISILIRNGGIDSSGMDVPPVSL